MTSSYAQHRTTGAVADMLGVSKSTLLRWLRRGEVPEPQSVVVGGVRHRLWSDGDLAVARDHMGRCYRKRRPIGKAVADGR